MVQCTDDGTLVPGKGTILPMSQSGTLVELQSELGTMVINSDIDEQTMKSINILCVFVCIFISCRF